MKTLDIINLIEKNPIIKLTNTFNNQLLIKIKENFTEFQQHLLLIAFYCCINYDQNTDYVINFDDIWKWLEFNEKEYAEQLFRKEFIIDIDYKILFLNQPNDEYKIMLNINTFKLFCIIANSYKANEFNKYCIKLECLLHDIVSKEENQLKLRLSELIYNHDGELLPLAHKNHIIENNNKIFKSEIQEDSAKLSPVQFYDDTLIQELIKNNKILINKVENLENYIRKTKCNEY